MTDLLCGMRGLPFCFLREYTLFIRKLLLSFRSSLESLRRKGREKLMIKNAVFDMGNVLSVYDPERYLNRTVDDPKAAKAVLKELFYGPEWKLLDAGGITEKEAVARVKARIPEYAAEVRLAMKNWHCMMTTMPGMADVVSDLKKKGLKLYLLSNTSLRFYRYYKESEIFRLFEGFVISAKEKLVKPDPAIFQRACERFRLVPEECLFVDDVRENVDGAVRAGMTAHLFIGTRELRNFLEQSGIL